MHLPRPHSVGWFASRGYGEFTLFPSYPKFPTHLSFREISNTYLLQLQYHLYSQPRPDTLQRRFFISDSIREDLQKRSETIHTAPAPGLGLPEEIQGYHSLIPIEAVVPEKRKFGSFVSVTYRAINSKDGLPYVLRRVESAFSSFSLYFSVPVIVQRGTGFVRFPSRPTSCVLRD